MINTATIIGRLTAVPELRQVQSGNHYARFSVAVDRSYVGSDGQRQADFIPVVAWGKTADFIAKYFGKGDMIAITGTIETNNYTDKEGNRRSTFDLRADNVSFCGGRNSSSNSNGNQQYQQSAQPVQQVRQQQYSPAPQMNQPAPAPQAQSQQYQTVQPVQQSQVQPTQQQAQPQYGQVQNAPIQQQPAPAPQVQPTQQYQQPQQNVQQRYQNPDPNAGFEEVLDDDDLPF